MSLNVGRPKAENTISFKFLEIIAVRKRPLTGIGKTCILPEDLRGCSIGEEALGDAERKPTVKTQKKKWENPLKGEKGKREVGKVDRLKFAKNSRQG